MLIGMIGLLGWIFDIGIFKQFLYFGIAIKANTAIALIVAGLSLCLFILDQQHGWARRTGQVCAALALIVGMLSLSEHAVGWNLGIDQLLFHEPPGPPGSLSPGRPGLPASLCFILGGLALLLLHERSKKNRLLVQILAVGVGLIAAPGLIGYAYGAESLYGIAQYTAIAFHTALAFALLAAGIFFAYPKEGIASLVYDKGIGGSIARRLLPPAILVPLVLGWFRLRGEEQGYFIAAFGTAVMMLIMMTLLSTLVLRTAAVSRHSERQQLLAEEALLTANQELEHRVAERTDELRTAFSYARNLLEASLDPLVTISPEGKITDVNQATELATDLTRKELIGSDFSSYFTEPQKANEGYRKVISEGFVKDYPLTIRHASGKTMDVLYNATLYKNEAGQVQGVFAAARDITERKRAEEELNHYREHLEELVAKRTEELSRSNRDLEQFAYAASHDLQEPLRMIAGYLQLLSERYKGQLDEKADKYIDYSVDGASRMSILIRDLLDYSRVNTRGEELRIVDCNKAFESAMRNLGSAIKESAATITHDSLPVVRADQTQLAQLFQNLVGNAIKFRSPQRLPQVHVSARKDQTHWIFRVQDNGIGFEQQYEDKIFMIFQRLHGRGQYPGTGIGLAICKRIIERHGGKIWADSEPDKGTNFFFTIPI
ncbi:MAG: ATP-binding protein [Thermoguttaceae bacterium]|jgi:PAS domain S-box-containing protein